MEKFDIAVVGGGASGLFAALCVSKEFSTVVLEKNDRCGKKLSATGNGQGNLTNKNIAIERYHGGGVDFAYSLIEKYSEKALEILQGLGLVFQEDEGGKVYPRSRQASVLTDFLRLTCKNQKVTEKCGFEVVSVKKTGKYFLLTSANGDSVQARCVIFAFGGKAAPSFGTDGKSYPLLQSFGHTITPLIPSLLQLKTDTTHIKTLRGIKCEALVKVMAGGKEIAKSQNELLFTEYGVSGSVIFDISGYATEAMERGKKVILQINFLPDLNLENLISFINQRIEISPQTMTEDFLSGLLQKQIARMALKFCGIPSKPILQLTAMKMNKLIDVLTGFELIVTGNTGFQNAQVTKGGISLSEFDSHLMSKYCAGCFACGELLDVDGDCGGFNLHFAWCSALAVSEGCIKYLKGK